MIFVLGGFIILIISFAVAFFSLLREQSKQPEVEDFKNKTETNTVANAVPMNEHLEEVTKPAENESNADDEAKYAQREEAYRVLQNKVLEMTKKNASEDIQPNMVQFAEDPDTSIEDTAEAEIALSEKVPLPWEDPGVIENTYKEVTAPSGDAPVFQKNAEVEKESEVSDKLSGQINIGDLEKGE